MPLHHLKQNKPHNVTPITQVFHIQICKLFSSTTAQNIVNKIKIIWNTYFSVFQAIDVILIYIIKKTDAQYTDV